MVCQMPLLPEATSFSRSIIKAKPAARPQTRDTAIFLASAEPLFLFFHTIFLTFVHFPVCFVHIRPILPRQTVGRKEKSAFQAIFRKV